MSAHTSTRSPDDALHRKAAAVDQRIDIFDMESAAGSGALDSLSCFVHGDAIDMESRTSRFLCGKETFRTYIQSRSSGHWFPGNGEATASELNTAILFLHLENFATPRSDVACKQRAEWTFSPKPENLGIQTEFVDGQGHRHVTDAAALKIILDALPAEAPRRLLGGPVVVRAGRPARTELGDGGPVPGALENRCASRVR